MSTALDGAVELLDRSLAYTSGALSTVDATRLAAPTPCGRWTLETLLAHMGDSLDAFLEAAEGVVAVAPPAPAADRVDALREKACALLGAWVRARHDAVLVGDAALASPVLVAAAALEIAVHGWDVRQATGRPRPLPPDLARGLLGVAGRLVDDRDRGVRFGRPRPVPADATPDVRLLAFLGRDLTGPPEGISAIPPRPPAGVA
ncbi:TIGR03086 family metal-binding protein [Nocardioides dongkuii]|uniref:TIGR03086 family metal-binding protein n=1 Tax=Nocardioides dongkuii TaxID=2760089 RepID=UPI0015FC2FAB|nr:TIGR03086 family metal-binding protein [Nocardioides dongkuii]